MVKYICTKKCFYLNRLWTPGETLAPEAGKPVPAHFKPASEVKKKPEVKAEVPTTFHGLQQQEAKDVIAQERPESAPKAEDGMFE